MAWTIKRVEKHSRLISMIETYWTRGLRTVLTVRNKLVSEKRSPQMDEGSIVPSDYLYTAMSDERKVLLK